MKMKTERGRKKVGRRLGLPEAKPKDTIRRVSLTRPVERDVLAPRPEAPDLAGAAQPPEERPAPEDTAEAPVEEGAPSPLADEQR